MCTPDDPLFPVVLLDGGRVDGVLVRVVGVFGWDGVVWVFV